jgi:hypothetical protein
MYAHRKTSVSVFEAVLLLAKKWKQVKCPPTEQWVHKMWYGYTVALLLNNTKE